MVNLGSKLKNLKKRAKSVGIGLGILALAAGCEQPRETIVQGRVIDCVYHQNGTNGSRAPKYIAIIEIKEDTIKLESFWGEARYENNTYKKDDSVTIIKKEYQSGEKKYSFLK